ncbi:MAG: hypothetical protein GY906_12795 [bacterium]|nr:hypothetical protein [bacterium]
MSINRNLRYVVYENGILVASYKTVRDSFLDGCNRVLGDPGVFVTVTDMKELRKATCGKYPPSRVTWRSALSPRKLAPKNMDAMKVDELTSLVGSDWKGERGSRTIDVGHGMSITISYTDGGASPLSKAIRLDNAIIPAILKWSKETRQ